MKFSVFSLMQWPDDSRSSSMLYGDEIAQVVEAERLGYDRAWFAEHHFSRYGISPAIHLTIAHVAARTHRIRLGTGVTIVPFMHPLRLAGELAVLDILSDGRIDWGAGRGYQRYEFDRYGIDIEESRDRFQESLEIVFAAWKDKPFIHEGRFWSFEETDVYPKPLQEPIPTFVAALSPSTLTWVAEQGLPFLADQFTYSDSLGDIRRTFMQARCEAGYEGEIELPVLRQVFVGRTTQEARAVAGRGLLTYYRMLAAVGRPAREGETLPDGYADGRTYNFFMKLQGRVNESSSDEFVDHLLDKVAIVGSPEEVAERITGLQEAGFDSLLTWQNFGGIPHDASIASMRLFMDEVAPNLPR